MAAHYIAAKVLRCSGPCGSPALLWKPARADNPGAWSTAMTIWSEARASAERWS